jgi:hypothetical protein
MILIYRADNPDDVKYPFGQDLYKNRLVVYHGTRSTYRA